jgi:alpha-L-rhamnosidase
MPLYAGLIPNEDESLVFKNLVNSIVENDYALTSGDIGYHFLVRVLSENGRSDILYKMNNRSDRPGYGYQLKKGATALTESWAARSDVSNNHMMLGHLMEWFYTGLGGIFQEEHSIAYSDIIIAPKPVGNIRWVKCAYNSKKGVIKSEWEIENNRFNLKLEVPADVTAKIIIPREYMKSSIELLDLKSQQIVEVNSDNGGFKVPAGKYRVIENSGS